MKISTIEFLLRRNLGNYEHSEIKLHAVMDEGDSHESAINTLKLTAHKALHGDVAPVAEVPSTVKEEPKQAEKPPVIEDNKEEELKKQKEAAAEAKAIKDAEKAKAAEEKAAKTAAKTVEKYDPNIKEHTDTVAAQLNKLFGNAWKADKVHAKKVSRETLVGFDFRNKESGEVLESFIAALKANFQLAENAL